MKDDDGSNQKSSPEKLLLRLPPDLKAWLKDEADKNRRSLNSEILMILEGCRRQK